jgi:hypothetical protein
MRLLIFNEVSGKLALREKCIGCNDLAIDIKRI